MLIKESKKSNEDFKKAKPVLKNKNSPSQNLIEMSRKLSNHWSISGQNRDKSSNEPQKCTLKRCSFFLQKTCLKF